LVIIKHFFKCVELVSLPHCSSIGGTTYTFLDRVHNRFGILAKAFTYQGMEFYEEFQELLCEKNPYQLSNYFTRPSWSWWVTWTNSLNNETWIVQVHAISRSYTRLGLVVAMINHGYWFSQQALLAFFSPYFFLFCCDLELLSLIHWNVMIILNLDDLVTSL
jgi:hypothetical protein